MPRLTAVVLLLLLVSPAFGQPPHRPADPPPGGVLIPLLGGCCLVVVWLVATVVPVAIAAKRGRPDAVNIGIVAFTLAPICLVGPIIATIWALRPIEPDDDEDDD